MTKCPIGYASRSLNPGYVPCTHPKGHAQIGPGGQNRTLFDHGNDQHKVWWNNDSRFLVIDHGLSPEGYPRFDQDHRSPDTMGAIVADVSRWIDENPRNKTNTFTENLLLRTSVKIGEEAGELNEALIGVLGQNPRKGSAHTMQDVEQELLDIAFTALGGVEHLHGNNGTSILRLSDHIVRIANRMVASQAEQATKRAEFDYAIKNARPVDGAVAQMLAVKAAKNLPT